MCAAAAATVASRLQPLLGICQELLQAPSGQSRPSHCSCDHNPAGI